MKYIYDKVNQYWWGLETYKSYCSFSIFLQQVKLYTYNQFYIHKALNEDHIALYITHSQVFKSNHCITSSKSTGREWSCLYSLLISSPLLGFTVTMNTKNSHVQKCGIVLVLIMKLQSVVFAHELHEIKGQGASLCQIPPNKVLQFNLTILVFSTENNIFVL